MDPNAPLSNNTATSGQQSSGQASNTPIEDPSGDGPVTITNEQAATPGIHQVPHGAN